MGVGQVYGKFFLNFLFDFSDKKDSIRKKSKTIFFDLLARSPTLGLSPGPKNHIWVKQKKITQMII